MSDKMRWRYGDTNPVVAAVDRDTVIELGDVLWQDADDAKPAWTLHDFEKFSDNFLGVAMQRSRKGDHAPIRVATTGVFEFDCVPETFELGNPVSPDGECSGLQSQMVMKTSSYARAIGRVAKREPTAARSVYVAIYSTVMTGGV